MLELATRPTVIEPSAAERRLAELWREIRELQAAVDVLEWDLRTRMPAGAQQARGETMATLVGLTHRRLASAELSEVLAACAEQAEPGSLLQAQVTCAHLEVDRAVRVPEALARAIAEASAAGIAAWQRAREASDFGLFQPELERMVALKREQASAIHPGSRAYDAMLQDFEPGATEAELAALLGELRAGLVPLVRAAGERRVRLDESFFAGHFPRAKQLELGRQIAEAVGFDFDKGRLDSSDHPFCIGFHPTDVRLTWRRKADDFRPGLLGLIHEIGHGLYEQGLPAEWSRLPVGRDASCGIHESQARLWENHVGRSRGFWRWLIPRYARAFPQVSAGNVPAVDAQTVWPVLHTVAPSLIRIEADEATYNLHIVVRFELERALFNRQLEVADLPATWNDLYEDVLGIRPRNAAEGVLQDIHWSEGLFGYFPTYAVGSAAAAQLFAAARRDLGDLDESFAIGHFEPLHHWLRDRIHRHASRYPAGELIERATGRPFAAADLLAHLRRNTEEVYGRC